ncbi:MAG TPA: lipoyl synthase [Acidimicrobiia bacterium]|nr:lipoyl synthase [Acidimicrobiia bacterium]
MSRLRVRWLGRVPYGEADELQRALLERAADDYLLLLEHPPVYTLGKSADPAHVLVPPASVGADLVRADRGGDVTYHGPGQLVGYPIVTLPEWRAGQRDVVAYVRRLEAVLIAALADLGVQAGRDDGYTGVWVGDEKVAAIGVRVSQGRTRHGFALNVDPDLSMFGHIVPCGIADRGVTSLAARLGAAPTMQQVVDAVTARFAEHFPYDAVDRQDVVWREHPSDLSAFTREGAADESGGGSRITNAPVRLLGRLAEAGVEAPPEDPAFRRPAWMKVKADLGPNYRETKRIMRGLSLHTVCEEAGCPNIYECWADKTATFMILGERCTRACGFCLVDTRHPLPLDDGEPARVADAVAQLGLAHAVITSVARDDVPDGGAGVFAATIRAVRARTPRTAVEVLIPDCKGDPGALATIFDARPDVLNHNLETVARLQRAARPSAAYFRSLALLARAKDAGLTTKSGIILGMGETEDELHGAIADLRNVGVDILTLGQYLRPTARHLPVVRWWTPAEFDALGAYARGLGFAHVESGPLVRSSYHARSAAASTSGEPAPAAAGVS